MIGWWWWFNVKFYYLSYILGWKEGARMESSTLSWYWRIVSSSWNFIPPFTFGRCRYLWKSLLPLNNDYWLFRIYCAWCIVVYWCKYYTIVHCSLDIVEWFKYKLKNVLNCTWYWFTPLSVSTIVTFFLRMCTVVTSLLRDKSPPFQQACFHCILQFQLISLLNRKPVLLYLCYFVLNTC